MKYRVLLLCFILVGAVSGSAQIAQEADSLEARFLTQDEMDLFSLEEVPSGNTEERPGDPLTGFPTLSWVDSLLLGDPTSGQDGSPEDHMVDSLVSGESWPLFPPRILDFQSLQLQDILRSTMLEEDETESWTSLFSVDSTLSLSLLQVKEEAWEYFCPYSDLWYYIWRGWGTLLLEGQEQNYSPGMMFQVPASSIHALRNVSGAPTVALVWQSPALSDSLRVSIIPEEILVEMEADSLRILELEEKILYRKR
ncbi:MAG: cupin domain-containing protein [Candidatus Krumholzibacteria bacterium]|nr:cupin domain-containing protein [Candidatus Krumholzibacteria bacterium]MDP6669953.1 cupin domain-containing protein [Candidatus Krumholzibacteria bacterium]MDP6797718.1 cupin domain-containing protein [Candidatus Krumholzibacteria bacterium]MDP7020827.1 cupin domain-containing protein [Candidatus Krumholzibacteria bacterium]